MELLEADRSGASRVEQHSGEPAVLFTVGSDGNFRKAAAISRRTRLARMGANPEGKSAEGRRQLDVDVVRVLERQDRDTSIGQVVDLAVLDADLG